MPSSLVRVSWMIPLLLVTTPTLAALSGNLVGGGDFENTSSLVNETSPDGIPPHRFSTTYDLNRWISHWGPTTNPGGLGGFSLYNNPRDINEVGGTTQQDSGLGNFNRSVDPTNASNHVMEAVMFRPTLAQWIVAPDNQVAGPIHFSFDFYLHDGHTYDSWGTTYVFGMDYLPPNDVTFFRHPDPGSPGATWVYDPDYNPDDGEVIYMVNYGEWLEGSTNGIDPPYVYNDVWHSYNTDTYLENEEGSPIEPDGTPNYQYWATRQITNHITQTHPYYVIVVNPVIYDETDPYFWLYGSKITPEVEFLYDNFDFRVSTVLPGDMNLDGLVNVQDINPFVVALGSTANYKAYLANQMATYAITSPVDDVYALVDPNGDGVINVQDINTFVALLAGAGVDTAQLAAIPEPASLTLLTLGSLALLRRR